MERLIPSIYQGEVALGVFCKNVVCADPQRRQEASYSLYFSPNRSTSAVRQVSVFPGAIGIATLSTDISEPRVLVQNGPNFRNEN